MQHILEPREYETLIKKAKMLDWNTSVAATTHQVPGMCGPSVYLDIYTRDELVDQLVKENEARAKKASELWHDRERLRPKEIEADKQRYLKNVWAIAFVIAWILHIARSII